MNQSAQYLTARMIEHLQTIERFLGRPMEERLPIAERAYFLASLLAKRSGSPEHERLARDVCNFIHPGEHPSKTFWASELGQDVAWHIGYPFDQVPAWGAAAVLGMNRVSIWRIQRQLGEPINALRLRELARSRN